MKNKTILVKNRSKSLSIEKKSCEIYRITMITPHSLEPLCKEEAIKWKAFKATENPGKVDLEAPLETAYQLCLHSRFASRILLELTQFEAANQEEFYRNAIDFAWEKEIPEDSTLAIDCKIHSTRNTMLTNSMFAAQLLKDAVCDRLRKVCGKRPNIDTHFPDIRLSLTIRQTHCSIALDFSGEPLFKRGYRKKTGEAPLKENLAAAILARAGWEKAAQEGRVFLDPMCGSATFAIEAAFMAAQIAPAIHRKYFGFLRWQNHKSALWKSLQEKAKADFAQRLSKIPPITAVEINKEAYEAAKENIANAGLNEKINLIHSDIFKLPFDALFPSLPKSENLPLGFIAVNPPYGERMGDLRQAQIICRQIGIEFPKRFPNWKMALFAGSKELSMATGLRPYKTNPLKNGTIESILACYDFSDIQEEQESNAKASEGQAMFINRLKKKQRQLNAWIKNNRISCYRLYDADMPEYAVAIDSYDTQEEGLHIVIAEYAPPPTVPQQARNRRLNLILEAVPSFFQLSPDKIHLKVRKKQKGTTQYEKSRTQFNFYTVIEEGIQFKVDFDRYLDTGLFLDHRPVRKLIKNILLEKGSKKKNQPLAFLNLFSYTCSASLYAASAKAQTVNVDLSKTYLEWGKDNFQLNRLSLKPHRFVQSDIFEFLDTEKGKYDLIYIDPPTFSNSKKTEKDFSVELDYFSLLDKAEKLLAPDGEILFSNNFRKFKLDHNKLSAFFISEISETTIDPDFLGNKKIHQAWRLKKKNNRK